MSDKEISIEESLQIMQGMVNQAKKKISEDGVLFIFWGWLVLAASLAYYLMLTTGVEPGKAWMVWLLMPVGGVFSIIYSIRKSKKEKVKTYLDSYLGYLWAAFGIALTITLTFGWKLQMGCYPMVILLYGIGTFVTGGMIRFLPLTICGALSFVISCSAFLVSFENQVLLLALSILVSYLIPGHWLFIKAKRNGV